MRKSVSRVRTQLEVMESRALLSGFAGITAVPAAHLAIAEVERLPASRRPDVSLDSVSIANRTTHAIEVTAVLKSAPVRRLTETIPAERSPGNPVIKTFDFRNNANLYITINVRRLDGRMPPRPFVDAPLNKPFGGYEGKLFSISVTGDVFSVSG